MKAIERDAAACVTQRLDAVSDAQPRVTGLTAHIDDVRAIGHQTSCLPQDLRLLQLGSVIDFGNDLDRIGTHIVGDRPACSKELGQLPQIARTTLDWHTSGLSQGAQVTAAIPRNQHA